MRPALLIAEVPSTYGDWIVCMMSSQIQQSLTGIDDLICRTDTDFQTSGLKSDTLIRLTRLAVVSDSIFKGKIGEIGQDRLKLLKKNLAEWIEK